MDSLKLEIICAKHKNKSIQNCVRYSADKKNHGWNSGRINIIETNEIITHISKINQGCLIMNSPEKDNTISFANDKPKTSWSFACYETSTTNPYLVRKHELSVVISPLNWWYVIFTDGHVLMLMCFSWFSNWFGRFFRIKRCMVFLWLIFVKPIAPSHILYVALACGNWKKYGNMNSISLSFQLRWLLSAMLEVQAPWDCNFIW